MRRGEPWLLLACALGAVLAAPAGAEKADREKPINFSADQPAEVDFEKRVGTLRGNVVITQGTTTIRADRIEFKQNADNSLSATAYRQSGQLPPEKGRRRTSTSKVSRSARSTTARSSCSSFSTGRC